jgi:hypothetical protein
LFFFSGITCVADFRVADVAAGGQVDQYPLKQMNVKNPSSTIRRMFYA